MVSWLSADLSWRACPANRARSSRLSICEMAAPRFHPTANAATTVSQSTSRIVKRNIGRGRTSDGLLAVPQRPVVYKFLSTVPTVSLIEMAHAHAIGDDRPHVLNEIIDRGATI